MSKQILVVAMLFISLMRSEAIAAAYTTPNTGVRWTLDSLVLYSAGTVTGSFPNYSQIDLVTISANDRLDILPRSVITVSQGSGIGFTVFGVMTAIGTPTDSIIIKGSSPAAAWYRGIRLEDSSIDSLCRFSYCRIQDATEGIHCLNASPTITNSLFTNNSGNGVRCFSASPIVRNCVFVENRRNGITANLGSSPIIENNLFANNNSQNTGAWNQIAIGGQGINNPIIRFNEIYGSTYFRTGAISLANIESGGGCNALVEGNYLYNNSFGILCQGPNMNPIIRYNRIENNRINPDPQVSGSGITVQTGGATNTPTITGNTVRGNYWGITIVSSSGLTNSPQPNLGNISNADTSDDGWNIFENNHNGGIIYQLYNNGTSNVFAQNNYWGSTDSTVVESWITHRPDSSVFGLVNYKPFGKKGLGIPDSFSVRQSGETHALLSWSFPPQFGSGTIRLMNGYDSLSLTTIAVLPDTQRSYLHDFEYNPKFFYALTSSNRFGQGDTTVRIFSYINSVTDLNQQPEAFTLYQNYPNPWNSSTTVWYGIPESGFVEFEVVDLLGRRIALPVSEIQQPGTYSVTIDGSNLASGIYYYKLASGRYSEVRRFVLLK